MYNQTKILITHIVYLYACTYIHIYIYIYIYYVYVCMYVCMYLHDTYVHMYMHIKTSRSHLSSVAGPMDIKKPLKS